MTSLDQQLIFTNPLRRSARTASAGAVQVVAAGGLKDSELIRRSLRDPELFGMVFDRHWASIHGYCTSRAGAAGEDIAAEVFRLAFDRRRGYRSVGESARPWLYGIATNELRHHFRSGQRGQRAGQRLQALAELEEIPQPPEQIEAQVLGANLTAALAALSETDREALLLFAWAELTYHEIADALAVPVGTVRSRIHRARARVREHIVMNSQGDNSDE